jgi:4-aminobutyrate aminotransferase/(S)-3-amino-2-methylpropionate transaminase
MTNQSILERRERAVPRGVATATPVFAARAENAEIWDVEGKRYVDFAGGIAVLNVGHRHPRVMAAVAEQLDAYTHTAFQVMAYEPYIELAEKLNAIAPVEGEAKTIFFTTGAEATENAVKIARAATGRPGIIAFAGGFHGRTLLSSAMTGKVNPYKRGLGPFPPKSTTSRSPRIERRHAGPDAQGAGFPVRGGHRAGTHRGVHHRAGAGRGGFHMADPGLFEALDKLRQTYGILIIADEVQTGLPARARCSASNTSR